MLAAARAVLTGLALFFCLLPGRRGVLATGDQTAPRPASKTVSLLTVGNSFSGNATRYLQDLARSAGHTLVHEKLEVGGAPLQLHWTRAELHEREPENPAGLYGKRSLKQVLQSRAWDAVTIQQASIKSHDVATYRPFARELHDYIKRQAPGARVLLHQTWAYRSDAPRFRTATPAPGEPATQAEMYAMSSAAYKTVAAELSVRRIPVGDAFYLADTDPEWGYKPVVNFDAGTADPAALPQQLHSLHVGWLRSRKADGTVKLSMDGHHANAAGQYLGACVWFEVLFGESVVGNRFVAAGVEVAHARFLQETAHRAVASAAQEAPAVR